MTFRLKEIVKIFIIFKNTLEGSLRKYPNIIFYVTSNYRHLVKNMENNNAKQTHKKMLLKI